VQQRCAESRLRVTIDVLMGLVAARLLRRHRALECKADVGARQQVVIDVAEKCDGEAHGHGADAFGDVGVVRPSINRR
jgi:hypothetical protein